MTAQIKDKLIYSGEAFSILRIEGKSLFNPANYGIKTVALSSACGRGFHCTYKFKNDSLRLKEVYLALEYLERKKIELGKDIRLFGKVPNPLYKHASEFVCKDLDQLIEFSGGILIASDFIRELLRPWYIPDVYKYRIVYELIFESGQLIKAIDYSPEVSKLRNRIGDQEIDILEREEIEQWSKDCFQFDYH